LLSGLLSKTQVTKKGYAFRLEANHRGPVSTAQSLAMRVRMG